MAVVIRLTRHGQTKRPFYRIVAAEERARRDGKFLEVLGTYNPLPKEPIVKIKEDRIRKWIEQGARPKGHVISILRKLVPGLWEGRVSHQRGKIQAKRKARKARASEGSKKASSTKKTTAKKS